ncbi:Unconventional myosin-XV [Larimichthys crocea]|uniref:Uncharacterized protein n=1 Tax=Larimichthys crocea TaxID=215358 RepID=A0ACD3RTW7_LARCR|nr:Unconventional myosin-XV [Larimichthys crocea]
MIRVSRCFSLSIFDFQRVSLDGFGDGDLDERALQDSKYDMLEFAKKYFRQGTKGKGDSLKGKSKNRDSREPTDMIKFSKNPLTESLIEFTDPAMDRVAADLFLCIAKACEQNLKKTFQYGGRIIPPNSMELKAMMIALEVIEELCYEMSLHRLEAIEEYAIFLVTNRGQNVRPLNKNEYILDVATEAELVDTNYSFWFRRVIWTQPLKFENELSVAMHYNQILPDYRKGLMNVLPHGKVSDQQFHQISKLAALQHRAKDIIFIPSIHELSEYIAAPLFKKQPPQQWVTMVTQHMQQVQTLTPHQARAQFLGLISAFPMFGSSFFYIQSSSSTTFFAPCIIAVNQHGLHFLHKTTHELMTVVPLVEVQSSRTQRPTAGTSYPYVDLTVGDVNTQRVIQLQLEQGLELCRVIAMQVENMMSVREKRLTLPPSEITML